MAIFFANEGFKYQDLSFGVKGPSVEYKIENIEASIDQALQILYTGYDLIPEGSLSRYTTLSISEAVLYDPDAVYVGFNAFSQNGISFEGNTATSGTFNHFGSYRDGVDRFNWLLINVAITAVSLDNAVSTSASSDDRVLFASLLGGNDEIYLSQSADSFDVGSGNDVVYGFGGNDTLNGGSGNDTLKGGTGADSLIGGLGDDTYVVDNLSDTITEAANAGTDTVQSSATITLAANLENLTLMGSGAINGTGNTLNNVITGNSRNNTLNGGSGNDTLNGGSGTDTLIGGLGDDTYVTDGGDTITEAANAGTDTVQSSATITLAASLENLILMGSGAISGTGNTLNNVITGNSGNNTLSGGSGNDTLNGGLGGDTYVTDGGDTIIEAANAGTDTVQSSATITLAVNVENLTLTGSAAINGTGNDLNNVITGNSGKNSLTGGSGNDTLIGGVGNDTLIGGVGNDTFIFNSVTESGFTATASDVISDFVKVQDKINLSAIDAFARTVANDTFIWKGTAAFSSATQGEVRYQKFDVAGTANDHTMVWIDNDTDTAVEMAIRLTGLYDLTASDFIL